MKARYFAPAVVSVVLLLGPACGKISTGSPCERDEDCPSGSACVSLHSGVERRCYELCEKEEDCPSGELCSWPESPGELVCHPPFPVCEPEATDADCECGTLGGALRVQGVDGACTVEERDVTVCAWYRHTCFDGGCTTEYRRYSYPDDAGYLVQVGGPNRMPEGWEPDGSSGFDGGDLPPPSSCPAAASEF